MRIAGLQKCSLIDYPGKISCVIFTQGCNFRCPYCHNPELVIPEKFCPPIKEEELFSFLYSHRKYLEGVVLTGGEPTIQGDIVLFLERIKQLGYFVKLDTNGSQPQVLSKLLRLNLLDFIAMDVKAPLSKYHRTTNALFDVERIAQSIDIISGSQVKHEFRTTIMKSLCSREDLYEILSMIQGDESFCLQQCRLTEKMLDRNILANDLYSEKEFKELQQMITPKKAL